MAMLYKGFEILLEQRFCEFWHLDEDGDILQQHSECEDSTHAPVREYVAVDENTGERFIGAKDIATLKASIDKALDKAADNERR